MILDLKLFPQLTENTKFRYNSLSHCNLYEFNTGHLSILSSLLSIPYISSAYYVVVDLIISDGSFLSECNIEHSIVGIRSRQEADVELMVSQSHITSCLRSITSRVNTFSFSTMYAKILTVCGTFHLQISGNCHFIMSPPLKWNVRT